jgi:two-component system sensor histidine kinase RstB
LVSPIKKRLNALSRTAEELGRGVLTVRATDRSRDAIGSLATSFNRMAEEIARLIGAQQELLRTVSHEVRTPIQRVHIALELARDAQEETRRDEAFDRAEAALEDLERLIEELLTYARLEDHAPIAKREIELGALVAGVVSSLREIRGVKELIFLSAGAERRMTSAEPKLVERAVSNLIRNALLHSKSKVAVAIARVNQQIAIDVDDDGPGVAPEDRLRIFQPFQRAVREGEERSGFGLGLAIARSVAEAHRGTIEVFESDLGGARFRLSLPIV